MKNFSVLVMLAIAAPAGLVAENAPRRISQMAAVESATAKVMPDYSPIAKQLKIQGSVQLDAVIAEDGSVERVDVVSGNPVLTKPAAEALKKWHFKPFMDGDKASKVIASFEFNFKL